MATLFGTLYDRAALLRRVGNLAQVAGIREYAYTSGRADGLRAIEVNTGAFRFELLPGRCLDVGGMWFRGIPAGYHSKSGYRHPAYFNRVDPVGFLECFLGGALTTCGLHNTGAPSDCAGRHHQQHGGVANIPAEKLSVSETWDGDRCVFRVGGEVRHSSFYHGDLVLRRSITAQLGGTSLSIEDEVENLDFAPAPCLLLYHCQFGFPFLDAGSTLLTSPIRRSAAVPCTPEEELSRYASFGPPQDGAKENCFYHEFLPDGQGRATACLFNPELLDEGLGAYVRFRTDTLPLLVQWKMLRSREYVCGLEPANARLENRDDQTMAACTLQPLEKRTFRVELGILEGRDGFSRLLAESP